MKELDFDELDKAVNSLMSPAGNTVSEPDASVKDEVSAVTDAPAPIAESTTPTIEPAPQRVVPTKRAGRFMDVVHPSSDMRSPTAPSLPRRDTVSIAPPVRSSTPASASQKAPPVEDVAPEATLSIDTPKDNKPEVPAKEKDDSHGFSFPDPLDLVAKLQGKSAEDESEKDVVENQEDTTITLPSSDEVSENVSVSPDEPLQSLFLPDVKVEKRPLGVPSADDNSFEENEISLPKESKKDDDESPKKIDTLVTPDPTLAELGDEVLAIESDNGSTDVSTTTEPVSAPQTAVKPPASPLPADDSSASAPAISSIPRQYSVKPSSDDKHHEALYDTAAQAGTPLAHPVKKKSSWFIVLWIVLLMAVGVGGALAVYFFTVM